MDEIRKISKGLFSGIIEQLGWFEQTITHLRSLNYYTIYTIIKYD